MAGVNKVILIGNLGKDPELRYTPGGQPVASFPLATTERWSDKNGQRQDRTEWHNIVVWGKQAEYISNTVKKGVKVSLTGRIDNRQYDAKDGTKKYISEIVADNVIPFTDRRPSDDGQIADASVTQETPTATEDKVEDIIIPDEMPF